jgi:hypothetical protein
MYGLIVNLTAASGKREDLIRLLKEAAVDTPGCLRRCGQRLGG